MTYLYRTYSETMIVLRKALSLKGDSSIKSIAEYVGLRPNTLYKFVSGHINLSYKSADKLLQYLLENEPERLQQAENSAVPLL